jgi:anti-anti-sigma factor
VIGLGSADGVLTIRLGGEIDLANADQVEAEIEESIDSSVTEAVFELSEVEYLDSAGVRVLFVLADRLRTRQIGMRVVAPPGTPAHRVLELAGFPLDQG